MANNPSELKMTDTDQGCVFEVKVVPGASRDRIAGILGQALKVTVSSPPEKGAANQALLKILASHFNLRANRLKVLAGQRQHRKKILAVGLTSEDLKKS